MKSSIATEDLIAIPDDAYGSLWLAFSSRVRLFQWSCRSAKGFGVIGVQVEIVRYTDDSLPGWVECQLTDFHGRQWSFIEKLPIVTLEWLDAASSYPQPGIIACEIVDRPELDRRDVLEIDTKCPWHIEATSGETRFEVRPDQVVEFDWK